MNPGLCISVTSTQTDRTCKGSKDKGLVRTMSDKYMIREMDGRRSSVRLWRSPTSLTIRTPDSMTWPPMHLLTPALSHHLMGRSLCAVRLDTFGILAYSGILRAPHTLFPCKYRQSLSSRFLLYHSHMLTQLSRCKTDRTNQFTSSRILSQSQTNRH